MSAQWLSTEGTSRRTLCAAAVVLFAIAVRLALATVAEATTVTRIDFGSFEDLNIAGAPGESNVIAISFSVNPSFPADPNPGTYTINDAGATIAPGPGCDPVNPHQVTCPQRNPVTGDLIEHDVLVSAGDLADEVRIHSTGGGIGLSVHGDEGNDLLVGTASSMALPNLVGDAGNDRLEGIFEMSGGAGKDTLASGPGQQLLNGGDDRDVVTYASRTQPVEIDLRGGPVFPGPWPQGEDMILAVEDAVGGSGDDRFIGGAGANLLQGDGGDDVFDGGAGADTLDGDTGVDLVDYGGRSGGVVADLNGTPSSGDGTDGPPGSRDSLTGVEDVRTGPGDDTIVGSMADNWIDAGAGADVIAGGGGTDTIDYSSRAEPLLVELTGAPTSGDGTDGPEGARDTVASDVEDAIGGDGDDLLIGNDGINSLAGEAGDDVLTGEAGADELSGGPGFDIVDYADRSAAVLVDLDGAAGDDGAAAEHDTVGADVEGVWGGSGDDVLTGNAADNLLDGGVGADELHGLGGFDLADYAGRATAVRVDLDGQVGDDGASGEGDTVAADIEDVRGGGGDDILMGDGKDNFLIGGAGADTLDGGAGSDGLFGDDGDDVLRSRDDVEDGDFCGQGMDSVVADASDFVEVDCEQVERQAPTSPSSAPAPAPSASAPILPDTTAPAVIVKLGAAKLRRVLRHGLRAAVSCSEPCTVDARLTLRRKLAKRLRISRVVAVGATRLAAPGTTSVVLKVRSAARRRLRDLTTLRGSLTVKARDAAGNATVVKRQVTIRR